MTGKHHISSVFAIFLLAITAQSMFTSSMVREKALKSPLFTSDSLTGPTITTSCNMLDLSQKYNYSGLAASGYLTVGKNNSALAFLFYGKKGVTNKAELKNYPTILWLNGGPGSSSQMGNLQELGPLRLRRNFEVIVEANNYTWVNNFNVLFVDQPVGTGLSYADTTNGARPFAKSLSEVADDFYRALYELYHDRGCFSNQYFAIPGSSPLVIFGESYGGKYAPAIAQKIIQAKQAGGFLTGLKGVAIGDGFTEPYDILAEVGTYSFHLGLLDFQQRAKVEKILLNASRHHNARDYDKLHDDFDRALEYIVEKAGDINIYDIRIDGDYEELLQPYFRDEKIGAGIYGFNPEVVFDSQAESVFDSLYTDFMQPEVQRVQFLLNKKIPILIYNGQQDLIVSNPGTMRWADKLFYDNAHEFRDKLFEAWKIGDKIVGTKKAAGLLELRIVFKAGHLVPMDQPEASLDMATSFVNRVVALE